MKAMMLKRANDPLSLKCANYSDIMSVNEDSKHAFSLVAMIMHVDMFGPALEQRVKFME